MSLRSNRRRSQRKNVSEEDKVPVGDEKWLAEALQKIKDQRKALRKEKEQLEKIKEQLIKESEMNKEIEPSPAYVSVMAKIEEAAKKG